MNKYVRAGICEATGLLKCGWLKLTRGTNFSASMINLISPMTEITVDRGGSLHIGKNFKMRGGSMLRVRKGANVRIGNNFGMGDRNIITCYESVEIGDNVMFGPDVKVYDQDHDFRAPGGIAAGKYRTAPVKIGNNVWIGANCVILRGTEIGDNCVVAAGSIIKGVFEKNQMIHQKKETIVKTIIK